MLQELWAFAGIVFFNSQAFHNSALLAQLNGKLDIILSVRFTNVQLFLQDEPLLHNENFFQNRNDRYVVFCSDLGWVIHDPVHGDTRHFHHLSIEGGLRSFLDTFGFRAAANLARRDMAFVEMQRLFGKRDQFGLGRVVLCGGRSRVV